MTQTILAAIKEDHGRLREMMGRIQQERHDRPGVLDGSYREFHRLVDRHMRSEEKTFYPALLDDDRYREDALESAEEHHVMRLVLQELDDMAQSEERWLAKFGVLKAIVEHHLDREEARIFAELGEIADEDRQREMGRRFAAEERKPGVVELAGV